ncbi:MAG TPA: hypothetical protein DIC59_09585 [Candidatus Competibacteraceae bacterium]|nr:hypothetical protein [Candidatus Competibacteraceae bacterium]
MGAVGTVSTAGFGVADIGGGLVFDSRAAGVGAAAVAAGVGATAAVAAAGGVLGCCPPFLI